jgi:hypothetical protein
MGKFCGFFLTLYASRQQKSYLRPPFLAYIALATAWFLVLARLMLRSKSAALRRFAWGVSGGCLTGFQNFLKDSLTIVTATNSSIDATMPWGLLGFFVFMAVLTSFLGLLLLTACMKRYDATYSAAMFVGSFVVSASIMSAVHYDTFGHLEGTINWICYPAGLAILMSGVYMLITEDPTEEGEEDIRLSRSPSQASLVRVSWDDYNSCICTIMASPAHRDYPLLVATVRAAGRRRPVFLAHSNRPAAAKSSVSEVLSYCWFSDRGKA